MRPFPILLITVLGVTGPAAPQTPPEVTAISIPAGAPSACLAAAARGDEEAALALCREAVDGGSSEPRVLNALARAELERGDPARAEKVWRRLLQTRGWRFEWALGLAKALWRQERIREAEAVLRDAVKRDPSPAPHRELVGFLMSFSRWSDAAAAARQAVDRFPGDCSLHEALGVAEAGLGKDAVAAREIRTALKLGCPPLRWLKRGEIPHRIHRPEYRRLLDPHLLAQHLASLPEGEAVSRLRLLELVPDPAVAPMVGEAVVTSPHAQVKLAGLHLLQRMGRPAQSQWRRILDSPDIMLRKHALRMLARSDESWLLPALERHLEREKAPHNLDLTRVAVARRLARTDPSRARSLLEAVPGDSPVHPLAQAVLETLNPKTGDGHRAD